MATLQEKLVDGLHALPMRELTVIGDDACSWQVKCANADCDHFINYPKREGLPQPDGTVKWHDVEPADRYPRWCPPCGLEALRKARA